MRFVPDVHVGHVVWEAGVAGPEGGDDCHALGHVEDRRGRVRYVPALEDYGGALEGVLGLEKGRGEGKGVTYHLGRFYF